MSILSKVRVDGVDYDLMGLGGDVLPVGTEVDIDSTVAIPAGWEEVDDKYEIYSTDEKCIGRWIDGKPLYRKVLSYSISGQSAYPVNITIPTGYTSAEYTIRDMRGILYGSDYAINLNRSARWTNSDTAETMNLIQTIDGVHLVIIKADAEVNYFNGCDGIVIIEYTKTSDTANSPITKRIKKVSQIMPPELLEKYSTDEVVIGTWIDGKPLYRKTINCGALPDTSEKLVDIEVLNIAYIKSMEGIAFSGSTYFPINCVRIIDASNLEIGAHIYENQIRIETGTDRTSFTAFITIEYTKTTD